MCPLPTSRLGPSSAQGALASPPRGRTFLPYLICSAGSPGSALSGFESKVWFAAAVCKNRLRVHVFL